MHTSFFGEDGRLIRVQIEQRKDCPGLFHLDVSRGGVLIFTFTREELHRVLDNARDVLQVVADGAGCTPAEREAIR